MTQEEAKSTLVSKTVRGILQVLIPALLIGWGGTYITVRIALMEHEQKIKRNDERIEENKQDINNLEDSNLKIWKWIWQNDPGETRGDTIE